MIVIRNIVRIFDFENTKNVLSEGKFMGMIMEKSITVIPLLIMAALNYSSIKHNEKIFILLTLLFIFSIVHSMSSVNFQGMIHLSIFGIVLILLVLHVGNKASNSNDNIRNK